MKVAEFEKDEELGRDQKSDKMRTTGDDASPLKILQAPFPLLLSQPSLLDEF